ncbi:hypothetical protein RXV94_10200 [Yeosuana sp. MJ-SS3]|uniref:Lipocalin-like domain-containing protein n=1 Tax=Gilvirhabdus luticola TaxID=3079858 RepID=A0ABU3U813_9FLAO|nr:hypothetical protein [Yeosuana sp. MJ-SS3]MDU8886531.1 hypothetical protein [Yeosuana sp. MJ-SS3]
MKKSLVLLCTALLFLFLSNTYAQNTMIDSSDASSNDLTLEGVWELVSYYNYGDNGITDTIMSSKSYRQIKMYTKTKVMWSRFVESDTNDWFGYGTYTNSDTSLTEALDYGSKTMNPVISERESFNFDLILEKDKFTQIEIDEDGNPLLAENYIRIE